MEKGLAILGSTGSIGTQALDVAASSGYGVVALAANRNIRMLEAQARQFRPRCVAVMDAAAAKDLKVRLADTQVQVASGIEGVCEAAQMQEADVVLDAIVGIAGLRPAMSAIEAGKTLALANKETLVAGGELVTAAAKRAGVSILPVDSEHSAIFQSLQGVPEGALSRILLTASGGPFFGKKAEELERVTKAEALKHPNWVMGQKITIDSATLMNKGLEVIEAVHLFGLPAEKIEVLVHRQSVLHSAVELVDGAVIGQMGTPDMRLPIQYALTYPKRLDCPAGRLSLTEIGTLTFEKPDTDTFRCLRICQEAIAAGGLKPAAANGANEAAVQLFLEDKIGFLEIAELVEAATAAQEATSTVTLESVFAADALARRRVLEAKH